MSHSPPWHMVSMKVCLCRPLRKRACMVLWLLWARSHPEVHVHGALDAGCDNEAVVPVQCCGNSYFTATRTTRQAYPQRNMVHLLPEAPWSAYEGSAGRIGPHSAIRCPCRRAHSRLQTYPELDGPPASARTAGCNTWPKSAGSFGSYVLHIAAVDSPEDHVDPIPIPPGPILLLLIP